jgi:hypothetical protein
MKPFIPHVLLKTVREGSGRTPAILTFPELLNIAEGREVF